MKQSRVLMYPVLVIGYFLSTILSLRLNSILPFKEIFWNSFLVFIGMNVLVAFLYLKKNVVVNILIAVLIAYLSLFSAFKFSDFNFFPSDAYGIKTIIISNIIFSIILWEIVFKIKQKTAANNR